MRRKQSERNPAKTRLRQPSLGALSGTFSSIKTSKMAVRMAETSLLGDVELCVTGIKERSDGSAFLVGVLELE